MEQRAKPGGGFTLLDGAAAVIGAAVASVHFREAVLQDLTLLGWSLIWVTFAGVAVSTTGPFLFLERRYGRRPEGFPGIGDWLWLVLGLPWVASALVRPRTGSSTALAASGAMGLYQLTLWCSLGAACLVALAVIWKTWVAVSPERAERVGAGSWTDRVGLVLAVCWPLQWGFGLVVSE